MKKNNNRVGRIADQIHKDVSEILRRDIKDPRISWVTVNHVELSSDYSLAKIYWTSLKLEDKKNIASALEAATKYVRSILSKGFTTYTVPQIKFIYDESIERGAKMLEVLNQINHDENNHDKKSN